MSAMSSLPLFDGDHAMGGRIAGTGSWKRFARFVCGRKLPPAPAGASEGLEYRRRWGRLPPAATPSEGHATARRWFGFMVVSAGAALAVGAVWFADVQLDRTCSVEIARPAPLYMVGPHASPRGNMEIATLSAGERATVKRVRYGKELQSVQVQTDSGLKGWLITGNGVGLTGCLR